VITIIEDVQAQEDARGVALDQVGVSGIRYPIIVLDRAHERQQTVATLALSVSLPPEVKGTHMSRFIEVLEAHRGELTMRTLPAILGDLRRRLRADAARIEVTFPYFIERRAPVSGERGLLDYECTFVGTADGLEHDFMLGVRVPVASLCPCSKAISDYGAHNQRGYVTIEVRTVQGTRGQPELIWIEELVEIAERAASAPVYPLLKRPDERHVTMQAYDNPRFVEDIAREAAVSLQGDERIAWFRVHVVNKESIHNHDAFARLEWRRN
jgi:GTP cyclohydrolase I